MIHKFWFSFQDTNLMKQFYPISEKIVSFPVERCSNFPLKEKDFKDAGLPVSWCGVRGCKFRYFSTNPFHKWTPFFCKHKRTDYLISCIALHQILSGASFLQMNARTIGNKYSESNCDKKIYICNFCRTYAMREPTCHGSPSH